MSWTCDVCGKEHNFVDDVKFLKGDEIVKEEKDAETIICNLCLESLQNINKFIEALEEKDLEKFKDLVSALCVDDDDINEFNCFLSAFDLMYEDKEENLYYNSIRYSDSGALVYITCVNGIVSRIQDIYGSPDMDPDTKLNTSDVDKRSALMTLEKILEEKNRDLLAGVDN